MKFNISLFENVFDKIPKPKQAAWSDFTRRIEKPFTRFDKDGKGFVPAEFGIKHRLKENILNVSMVCFDVDYEITLEDLATKFQPLDCVFAIYSTHSHRRTTNKNQNASTRWRVILPFETAIDAKDFENVWRTVNDTLNLKADENAKDVSRISYFPCKFSDDAEYEFHIEQNNKFFDTSAFVQSNQAANFQNANSATNGQQNFTGAKIDFEFHDERHAEFINRFKLQAKQNGRGIYEMRCPVHNGNGKTSLFLKADAIKCGNGCDYFDLLTAFGLSNERLPNKAQVHFSANGNGSTNNGQNANAVDDSDFDEKEISLPELSDDALYGLAGDFVKAVLPHTEAHRAALLFQFLAFFGCVAGKNAFFHTGAKQFLNLFTLIIGKTGRKGRKGTALDNVTSLFDLISGEFVEARTLSTLASGQGLISQVADAKYKTDEHGLREKDENGREILLSAGVADKRLLVRAEEFGAVMKLQGVEGSILKDTLCVAWDGKPLSNPTRHHSERCANPHISVIGHITPFEFSQLLDDVDLSNGYFNRILLCYVWRERKLPEGCEIPAQILNKLCIAVKKALDFATEKRQFMRDEAARELWIRFYDSLDEDNEIGLIAEALSRAEAQVTRLSMMFACLDLSETIRREHLQAALAVWDYSKQSTNFIFRGRTGDKKADKILSELRKEYPHGILQSEIQTTIFQKNVSKLEIESTLLILLEARLIRREKISSESGKGRKGIYWFAVQCETQDKHITKETRETKECTSDLQNESTKSEKDSQSFVSLVSFVKPNSEKRDSENIKQSHQDLEVTFEC